MLGPEDLHYFKCGLTVLIAAANSPAGHTIFQTRLPDALSVPLMGSVALPDSLELGDGPET